MLMWEKRQVAEFVKQAKAPWGDCWRKLGPDFQEAIIGAAAMRVVRAQSFTCVPGKEADALYKAMYSAAGLGEGSLGGLRRKRGCGCGCGR